jgi:hypothetical protein
MVFRCGAKKILPKKVIAKSRANNSNTSTFMIAPQNEKVFWVFYLVCEEKANCFKGLLPSVHIIAEEEIICLWWESAILK